MEENSISIINRTNGQLTGEKAQALPIKFIGSFSWLKIYLLGLASGVLLLVIFVYTIKKQVVVVEVAGKSPDYQEYKIQ